MARGLSRLRPSSPRRSLRGRRSPINFRPLDSTPFTLRRAWKWPCPRSHRSCARSPIRGQRRVRKVAGCSPEFIEGSARGDPSSERRGRHRSESDRMPKAGDGSCPCAGLIWERHIEGRALRVEKSRTDTGLKPSSTRAGRAPSTPWPAGFGLPGESPELFTDGQVLATLDEEPVKHSITVDL